LSWTTEKVLDFAPDISTAESGQALSTKRKWLHLSSDQQHIWGEFKTIRGENYQSIIELKSPTFHCTCKSNKSPCKHIVGLLHLFADLPAEFKLPKDIPIWAKARIKNFTAQEKEETPEELAAKEAQNEAIRNKNRSKRLIQMEQGLEELETWLLDLIRQGLASTEGHSEQFWKEISTRLVDAKLGALGKRVRLLTEVYKEGLSWPERMLDTLAHLYLLVKGFKQLDNLPEPLQKDMLTTMGVNIKKDELYSISGIRDNWMILGQVHGVEERINFRRTWVQGIQSNQVGLILEFAWGDTGYMTNWPIGKIFSGELVFYPSQFPQRVLVKDHSPPFADVAQLPCYPDFEAALKNFAKAIGNNPWLHSYPIAIESVIPVFKKKQLILIDQKKNQIPTSTASKKLWKLLAISGGQAITLFGEWNGRIFDSLSVWSNDKLVDL